MRNKLAQKIKLGAALLLMAGTSAFAQTSNQIYIPSLGHLQYDRPRRMVYEHSQHQP